MLRTKVMVISSLIVSAVVVLMVVRHWGHQIIVENRAGQRIERLTVTVCGQPIRFQQIPPDEEVSSVFAITTDGSFAVRGQLADGTEISSHHGYVTSGMSNQSVYFRVLADGSIQFEQD